MSGPIVRSGPNNAYTENWNQVFGKKKTAKAAPKPKTTKKTTKKSAKKSTAKKSK